MGMLAALVIGLTAVTGLRLASSLSATEQQELVSLHNSLRSAVEPPAVSMSQLEWDDGLEAIAKQYAKRCSSVNPTLLDDEVIGYEGIGANVAVTEGPTYDLAEMVDSWLVEGADYDYYCNECKESGICRQYKQLMTESMKLLGCAIQSCEGFSENTEGQHPIILVCFYNERFPAIRQGRPYVSSVDTCIRCPDQLHCNEQSTRIPLKYTGSQDGAEVPDNKAIIEQCPPTCNLEYCQRDKRKMYIRPCSHTGPKGECRITSCRACYVSRRARDYPDGCKERECGDWKDRYCVHKWGRCIGEMDALAHPHHAGRVIQKKPKWFRCHVPPPE